MSTHLYLHCVSHTPYISSDQVGHSISDVGNIQRRVAAKGDFLDGLKASGLDIWDLDPVPSTERHINNFLHAHPNCDYELWDEYGHQHMLVPEGPEVLEFNEKGPYSTPTNLWVYYVDRRGDWAGPIRCIFTEIETRWIAENFMDHIYFLHDEG